MSRFFSRLFARQPADRRSAHEHSALVIVIKKSSGEIVKTISWQAPVMSV